MTLSISQNFQELDDLVACDSETALIPAAFKGRGYVRLIQFWCPSHSFWYDLKTFNEAQWQELKESLESSRFTFIFQNAGFDLRVLQHCKIHIKNLVHDTMIQSYLLNNGIPKRANNLAAIVERELGIKLDKTKQAQNWMDAELSDEDIAYGMADVEYTYKSHISQMQEIEKFQMDMVYEIERKAILPTVEMEMTGIFLDRHHLDEAAADYAEERDSSHTAFIEMLDDALPEGEKLPRLEDGVTINLNKKTSGNLRLGTKVYAGFNPGSSQQLLEKLHAIACEPVDKTGKPSAAKECMAEWRHIPCIPPYLSWKKADKALQHCQTLIKAQHEDGRVYAQFMQTGTMTGRYSSSKPNLQNVPKGPIRFAFGGVEGRAMVDIDFAGMELKACASKAIADEPNMRQVFNDGGDVHASTAAAMFKIPVEDVTKQQRQQAKATNFGALFGSSAQGLVNYFRGIGMTISLKEGEAFLNAWLEAYPAIGRWHNQMRAMCDENMPVRMVDGRRRFLTTEANRHTIFCNNTVQGSCASVVKLAMYGIHQEMKKIDPSARLVGMIHDELLIECNEKFADELLNLAELVMQSAGKEVFGDDITFTADGSVGATWGAAKA